MRKSQGQATVEYIFVLIVVLTIALGALAQFNVGFRNFVDSYYGQYLQCLLEVGELPSLGYEGEGECDNEFAPFTLASGRPRNPTIDVGPTPEAPTIADSRGANAAGTEAPVPPDPAGASAPASEGRGGGTNSVAIGKFDTNPFAQDSSRSKSVPLSQTDLRQGAGRFGFSGSPMNGNDPNDVSGGRPIQVPVRQSEEEQLNVQGRQAQVPATDRDLKGAGSRVPADAAQKKIRSSEDGWTFPDFLKLLLIIIIVIAMVVFFGGQFLQISKSQEK